MSTAQNKVGGLANGSYPSKQDNPTPATKPTPRVEATTLRKPDVNRANATSTSTPSIDESFPWRKIGSYTERMHYDPRFVTQTELVKTYVLEKFYSDFYWNTVLVVGNCVFAWLVGRWRYGIFGLVFIWLCTASVYRADIRRFKRNVRDDIQRIASAESLEKNIESMEWLNSFLTKFWVIYMPALSETVETIANETLKDLAPGYGIDALSLDEFNLGSKAPRIDAIKSYTKKGKDTIEMDWAFSFTPDDTSDMTKREIDKKINPKVALGVRVGKAFVSKKLPILVEDMNASGRMKVTLKLSLNFPHIKIVSLSLLEPPKIDFALKPVGGDTFGLDIMSLIPGLSGLITNLINSGAGPILYAPNHFDIDVEELMASFVQDCIGVAVVTIKGATGLKSDAEIINPYAQVFTDGEPDKHVRTDVKANTVSPNWNETKYVLVNNLEQNLNFELYNFSIDKKKGELFASHTFDLRDLLQKDVFTDVTKSVSMAGKKKGSINYDIRWFPVLTSNKATDQSESKEIEVADTEVGVLKLTLHDAKHLDVTSSLIGRLNPKAELFINDKSTKVYRTFKHSNEPSWNETFEVLVTEKSNTKVKIVISEAALDGDVTIATFEESLETIVFNVADGNDVFPLKPQGQIRVTGIWKPLSLSGVSTAANYVPPIGAIRVHIRDVSDVKNLEKVGKVDPYIKVLLNNRLKYQTRYFDDTTEAVFNDVVYIPINSRNQHLSLEAMDFQNLSKDRTLGAVNIPLIKFIQKNEEGTFLFFDGSKEIYSSKLRMKNNKEKGVLRYSISFIPAIPVYSISELEELEAKKDKIAAIKAKQAKESEEWEELYKKNPNDYEWVEVPNEAEEELGESKENLSLEQLLTYRSGTLGIHVYGGVVKRSDSYIQVLVDDYGSASFTSTRTSGTKVNPEVGDAFIRDLPNSRIILRLSKKSNVKDQDDVISEQAFSTGELLQKAFYKPYRLAFDGTQLNLRLEYIPSAIKLPESETIQDVGKAKIEILDAEGLAAADRNGKSDPFASLSVDGVKVFKTKTIKKTLSPTWNEAVTVPIPSRSRSDIELKVFDWDRAGKNEVIGSANLDISSVQAGKSEVITTKLSPQGSARIRITFSPEYVRPKVGAAGADSALAGLTNAPLKGISTAGDLAGGVVNGGVGVASGTLGAGAGAVSKGGHLFKSVLGGKKSRKSLDQPRNSADNTSAIENHSLKSGANGSGNGSVAAVPIAAGVAAGSPAIAAGNTFTPPPTPGHQRNASQATGATNATRATGATASSTSTPGKLIIRSGHNLGSHAQLKVSLASNNRLKEIYHTKSAKANNSTIRWDEEVSFNAPKETDIVFGGVVHHKFTKDQELGNASISLAEVIDSPRDITLDLGSGQIIVSFRYSPGN